MNGAQRSQLFSVINGFLRDVVITVLKSRLGIHDFGGTNFLKAVNSAVMFVPNMTVSHIATVFF